MAESRAALRYAKALMDHASEQKAADGIEKDMRQILDTLKESADLKQMISSPVLAGSEKKKALGAVFKGAQKESLQLFELLEDNGRLGLLESVAQQYIHLYEQMKGKDVAYVTTATPLTKELEAAILKQIEKITGNKVNISNEIDKEIIGGFILRVGDLQYNASIANQLSNLKRQFTQR